MTGATESHVEASLKRQGLESPGTSMLGGSCVLVLYGDGGVDAYVIERVREKKNIK